MHLVTGYTLYKCRPIWNAVSLLRLYTHNNNIHVAYKWTVTNSYIIHYTPLVSTYDIHDIICYMSEHYLSSTKRDWFFFRCQGDFMIKFRCVHAPSYLSYPQYTHVAQHHKSTSTTMLWKVTNYCTSIHSNSITIILMTLK